MKTNNPGNNNPPKYVKGEAPQFNETSLNKVWNEATSMTTDQLIAKIQKLHTAVAKKNKGWHRAEKALPMWKFVADKSGVVWEGEDDKAFQQVVDAELILAQQYSKKSERAKQRSVEWKLTFAQFKKIMSRRTCAYTGNKFTEVNFPTLDRLDPGKPYIVGNVYKVGNVANQLKNTLFEKPSNQPANLSMRIKFEDMEKLMAGLKKVGFDKVVVER